MEIVQSDDRLIRRVLFKEPRYYLRDDNRPASSCFTLRKDEKGLSVDLERLTTYNIAIQDIAKYRLVALEAKKVFDLGFSVLNDGIPNASHCLITGDFSKSNCRTLAMSAICIGYPDDTWFAI